MASSGPPYSGYEITRQKQDYRTTYEQLDKTVTGYLAPYRKAGVSDELINGSSLDFKVVMYDLKVVVGLLPPAARGFLIETTPANEFERLQRAIVSNPDYEDRHSDNSERSKTLSVMRSALEIISTRDVIFEGLRLKPLKAEP